MATAATAAKDFIDGPCVPEAVRKLLEQFPLGALCEALGNAQPADREILITALERLASSSEVCNSFLGGPEVSVFLRQGCASTDTRVHKLVARLLEQLAGSEAGASLLASHGLTAELEALILDEEVGVAESASRAICRFATWAVGREAIVGEGGLLGRSLMALQGSAMSDIHISDTKRIRLLHLYVELGRTSETDLFPALDAAGAFKLVLEAFFTDDILLKLNAVELMDSLGSYQAGQELLSKKGVPEQLAGDLIDSFCDESVRFCVTRLLGFVLLRSPSSMASLLPDWQAPLAQAIKAFLVSRSPPDRACALQVFGNICVHQEGVIFFLRAPEVLSTIASLAAAPQNDVCNQAMNAWCNVLNCATPNADTSSAGPGIEIWRFAEQNVLQPTLKCLAQKPFPEIRECSWRLLAVFARSQEAARKVLIADEMREMLLDFASDTASPAKIAKHEFVQSLVKHQGTWLAAFLDENIEMMLSEYAKQGPFWMPQVSSVGLASEGAA